MNKQAVTKIILGLLLIISACTSGLVAQVDSTMMMISPIETDRPDKSEAASVVPKGYFQMENGFSIEDTEPGFIYTHPSTLVRVGVSEHFEIRVAAEYINIQLDPNPKMDGLLPIQIGIKTRLLDQKGIVPSAAFIGHLSLPGVASEFFRQTYFAPSMRLAFAHSIHDRFSVSYNVGAEWDGETPRPDFIYTLALGAGIIHGLGAYVEIYGSVPQQREDDHELRLDGGFTYLISNDVLADISGGIGLTDNAPEKYIEVGFSYRFKM